MVEPTAGSPALGPCLSVCSQASEFIPGTWQTDCSARNQEVCRYTAGEANTEEPGMYRSVTVVNESRPIKPL